MSIQVRNAAVAATACVILLSAMTTYAQKSALQYGYYISNHMRAGLHTNEMFKVRFQEIAWYFDPRETMAGIFIRFGNAEVNEEVQQGPLKGSFERTRVSTIAFGGRWIWQTGGTVSLFLAPGFGIPSLQTYNYLRGTRLSTGKRKYETNTTDTYGDALFFDGNTGLTVTLHESSPTNPLSNKALQLKLAVGYETGLTHRLVALLAGERDLKTYYFLYGGVNLVYLF